MSGSSAGANLEPVRRFEVFTGEGRRRKWALADKMALVAEIAATDNISELAPPAWLEASATVHLAARAALCSRGHSAAPVRAGDRGAGSCHRR